MFHRLVRTKEFPQVAKGFRAYLRNLATSRIINSLGIVGGETRYYSPPPVPPWPLPP